MKNNNLKVFLIKENANIYKKDENKNEEEYYSLNDIVRKNIHFIIAINKKIFVLGFVK